MSDGNRFTFVDPTPVGATREVVARFIAAFQQKNPAAIPELVAPDCVMEAMQPAPDGQRVEGYEANVAFWQAMVADPNGSFEVEETVICGDRAINRWRYHFANGEAVRGVTLITVRAGKIAEALGYAKTSPVSDLGQQTTTEVISRYNDVFQTHDPRALSDLVATDCVIENTNPAPDGSRHVGREACVQHWSRIATDASLAFDIEDVSIDGERAIVRWRLRWGEGETSSVRGVNLMRVRDGLIVEALGYVKGA